MFASKDIFLKSSGGYQISRSVRLRSSASAYFNRTPASASNRKTWTWSGWVKRGSLGAAQILFSSDVGTSNSTWLEFGFDAADTFTITSYTTDSNTTAAVFRDPSSWYHIVVAFDSTQATSANRCKIYVNGTQQTLTGAGFTLNADYGINNAQAHAIGYRNWSTPGRYFDGYMTEINFIDGQALTPSSFGETNTVTGVWQPKAYAGTYGTNGFYLNFSDNSGVTATTIGKDYSGNGNNWTPNNISITAGTTYDSMLDVPTLYADGGNGRGNYAVGNPLYADASVSATYTNGNLTWSCPNTGSGKATISATTGKFYWEAIYLTNAFMTGVADVASVGRYNNSILYQSDGTKGINGTFTSYGATYTTGDVIGVALDLDGGTVTFYKNNSSQGSISLSLASITNATAIVVGGGGSSNTGNWNFGQRPFSYTPPTGFVALNTQNLSTPTISNGANYMAATTYTGTGSSLTIANTVNGISFQPDLVWVKGRSGATDHAWYDAVRGVQNQLESNTTTAETTETTGLTAFGSTGFTIGALAQMNTNAATYVAWQWNAGGSTVTNTSGSISAQVRANTTAGFSIATFSGASAGTVGHGLGVVPEMIIIKTRTTATGWYVYTKTIGASGWLQLNTTAAAVTGNPAAFGGTTPTSSVWSYGSGLVGTGDYVAYCFAPVAGYSAFGSYTGNGSTDGPFVFCGFRPRYLMYKQSNGVNGWVVIDSSRDTYNVSQNLLFPNTSGAESVVGIVDFLSNGFKLRYAGSGTNASGDTIIFAAFAENPLKFANAR